MLHGAHVVLGNGIGHVADEEILDRMTIREEGRSVRWFAVGHPRIVLSHKRPLLSCFHTEMSSFVFSPMDSADSCFYTARLVWASDRVSAHEDSCFHTERFVCSHGG